MSSWNATHYNQHRPHRARDLRPPDSDENAAAAITDPTAARVRRRRVCGCVNESDRGGVKINSKSKISQDKGSNSV